MDLSSRIYVAGHRGLVGSALVRCLQGRGYNNLLLRDHSELDLTEQQAVRELFAKERPEYVFLAAAKVGGIMANSAYPADFVGQNLMIQTNVVHQSYRFGVKRLLFLGSSCIYPKLACQPLREEYLLAGPRDPRTAHMRWRKSLASRCVGRITGSTVLTSWRRCRQTSMGQTTIMIRRIPMSSPPSS